MGAYSRGGCLFEGWALIREGRLFDNPVTRVDAYSRGARNQSITVIQLTKKCAFSFFYTRNSWP